MKKIVLLGLATLALTLGGFGSAKYMNKKADDLNARIIVQLKGNTNKSRDIIIQEQNIVLSSIGEFADYKVTDRFTNLVNGFAIDVSAAKVSAIKNLPDVKHVDYNVEHAISYQEEDLKKDIQRMLNLTATRDNISKDTMNVPNSTKEGEGVLIAILDTGYLLKGETYDADGHVTGTNVTHNAFTALAGNVAVHDTEASINSKIAADRSFHGKPDATHSVYFNSKVPFFYDYGGLTHERGTPGGEDYDVFSKGQEHGTHVASTAAGNDPLYKGIAPKAQLALMKVFTDYEPTKQDELDGATASTGAYDVCILKALEDCATLGVDIVSMSLGSSLDDFDSDSVVQNAIKSLQNKGCFVNVAAGNDGKNTFENSPYEFWTTDMAETGILSSYSNNEGAMTIAACQADKEYYETALVIGNTTVSFKDQVVNYTSSSGEVKYEPERRLTDLLADNPSGNFKWIRIGGWGEEKDYAGKNASGKIAIVDRGETTFVSKIDAATKAGAIAIGIINNDPTDTTFSFRMDLSGNNPKIPVVAMLFRDKATFDNATTDDALLLADTEANNPTKRTMTSFSSDGPTYDLRLKPEISTPGQSVLGAVIDTKDAYEYLDGTSMATPNYTGALAVVLSEKANERASLNALLMSTANPMKDKFGTNFDSVRKQGAGMVDIDSALKTKVYLDGATGNTLSGKAKIELGNNAKIKEGKVALSFSTVSKESSAVTYSATTYVYRPELVSLSESNENYKEFIGKKFQATYDKLVATATQNVTINPGTNVVSLNELAVPATELADINANFPDGCYLEGFVVLTADGKEDLSIPFLGYYGNYDGLLPVEPFKFERDNSKVYASDLVNYVTRNWGGSTEADFASDWVSGYYTDFNKINTESFLLNEKKLTDLVGSNSKKLTQVGLNPYTNVASPDDIYMGNNGVNNTMIIVQYVMRSVKTNTITLTNKATNKVVLIDHMYDDLFGAEEDENENEIAWPLYKTHVDTTYWSSKLYAHRAYTIIPLYDNIYDKTKEEGKRYKVGELYPDGEYEMKFEYVMAGGGTFVKTYTLHIDSEAPQVASRSEVKKGNDDYLRFRINEEKLAYATVNGDTLEVEKDENGYFLDLKKSDYAAKDKVFIKTFDFAGASSSSLTYVNDQYELVVSNDDIAGSMEFVSNAKQKGKELTFDVKINKKDGSAAKISGKVAVSLKLPAGYGDGNDLVFKVAGKEAKYTLKDGVLSFVTTADALSFSLYADSYVNTNPGGGNKGCGGDIMMASSLIVLVALCGVGFMLVSLKKRKEQD